MKYKSTFLIFFAVFFVSAGCVSLPEPIDEVYLKEKTPGESARLGKIEGDIVAKKKDKDSIEKNYEAALQRIEVSRREIAKIDAENLFLAEKEKLYTLTGENQKLPEIQKQREKGIVKSNQAKAYLDYNVAKKDEINALIEVKKSELGVRVAELDYEKSLIARVYQEKRSKDFKKNMIDEQEYKKFLDNQKKNLEDNQKKYEKAAKALSVAEEKFRKTGYEEEK